MGKGDVTMKFDADTADFVQKMMKMRQELLAAGSSSREFAKSIEFAGVKLGSLRDVGKSVSNEISGLAQSHLSFGNVVSTALGMAREAWALWGKHVDDISNRAKRTTDELSKAMANMGGGALLPEARLRLQNLSTPGMNMEQRIALFRQAASDSPDKNLDQLLASVQVASRGRLAGKDPAELLRTMSALEDAGFKGDARQAGDKANRFLELSGGRGLDDTAKNALLRFTQSGAGDLDQGLGFMLGIMKAGGSPQLLGSLVDQIARIEKPDNKPLKSFTAKERAQAKLAGMSISERFKAVTADRDLASDLLGPEGASQLLGSSGSRLGAVMASGAAEFTDQIRGSGGSLAKTAVELGQDARFRASLNEDKIKAQAEDEIGQYNDRRSFEFRIAKAFALKRNAGSPVRQAAAVRALEEAEKLGLSADWAIGEMSGEIAETPEGLGPAGPTVDEFRASLPSFKDAAAELNNAASSLSRSNREKREELLPPGMETGRIPARGR